MRSRRIGAVPPEGGWCPRFARRQKTERKQSAEVGQRKTQVMSYFPTRKGQPRMERLRHYWHVGMAAMLEVDPQVRSWTTEVEAVRLIAADEPLQFTPHMWVSAREGYRALRLVDGGENARGRWLSRHGFLRDRYLQDGADLLVVTREEVEGHPLLKAANTILYYRRWEVPENYVLRVASIVDDPPPTLGALHAELDPRQGSWPQILALVGQGLIEIEMSGRLDPEVPVVACLARKVR